MNSEGLFQRYKKLKGLFFLLCSLVRAFPPHQASESHPSVSITGRAGGQVKHAHLGWEEATVKPGDASTCPQIPGLNQNGDRGSPLDVNFDPSDRLKWWRLLSFCRNLPSERYVTAVPVTCRRACVCVCVCTAAFFPRCQLWWRRTRSCDNRTSHTTPSAGGSKNAAHLWPHRRGWPVRGDAGDPPR